MWVQLWWLRYLRWMDSGAICAVAGWCRAAAAFGGARPDANQGRAPVSPLALPWNSPAKLSPFSAVALASRLSQPHLYQGIAAPSQKRLDAATGNPENHPHRSSNRFSALLDVYPSHGETSMEPDPHRCLCTALFPTHAWQKHCHVPPVRLPLENL